MGALLGVTVFAAWCATCAVLVAVWAARRRLTCMAGMMVAMALGMVAGLAAGAGAGLARPEELWRSTVIGAAVGAGAGSLAGAPVGLMAVLDGALSGLMGGMMGAMLGAMAPGSAAEIMLAATALCLLTAGLLVVLIAREVGPERFWPALRDLLGGPVARTAVVAAAAGLGLGLAVLPPGQPTGAHHQTESVAAPPREVTVRASEFRYDTPAVQVARGERIRLRFINAGKVEHDINVTGLRAQVLAAAHGHGGGGVHAHAGPGQEAVVEFIAQESGLFQAACTVPGHERLGMQMQVAVR